MPQVCVCRDIEHLESLKSTKEARVALGCATCKSYASFVLSKLPACSISRHTHPNYFINIHLEKNFALRMNIVSSSSVVSFKVPMEWKIEVLKNRRIWKDFKSEEEWHFPFCHVSPGPREIQDVCIMQIRYWWHHKAWPFGSQNTK